MTSSRSALICASGLALAAALAAQPALAADSDQQPVATAAQPAADASAAPPAPAAPTPAAPATTTPAPQAQDAQPQDSDGGGSQTDIFSKNTVFLMLDTRLTVADGAKSFDNGGFGITRFQGDSKGGYAAQVAPEEADLVWSPRFTNSLSANVSAAWQKDHGPGVGLMEAFVSYLPAQTGAVSISARAGLMWPDISLEHSTGGAWTVVNTITPSAINSWVGEEVRVVGIETTVHASVADQELALTAGGFEYNDTSGTLLSFRGWALQDIKGTAPGNFSLPPLNPFIKLLQQNLTQNTINIDHTPGWYASLSWRPPAPFGVALFYYDNDGDPQAFTTQGQWGWRTRFWNLGVNADLDAKTRLLAQGMIGSTQMGFKTDGVPWVDTDYQAVYVMLTRQIGAFAVSGRVDGFQTREHGSEMPPDNDQDGYALTAAARINLNTHLTLLGEALNVRSWRGTRVDLGGLDSPYESQTVFQIALRCVI